MSESPPTSPQYSARRTGAAGRFLVRVLPTLAVLLLTPLLIGLGLWQLDRAEQKRELLAAFERGGRETLTLGEALASDPDASSYQRVVIDGRYLGTRQFLLDGQVERQRAGYDVLTPFAIEGGGTIPINRGFVPQGPTREPLADVAVDGAERRVTGRIAQLPRAGLRLGPASEAATPGWPRVMLYPEPAELESALGQPLIPHVVLLDPDQPDGYLRHWRVTDMPPERHIAYALQWFTFAATLVVIYVVLRRRRAARV